MKRALFFLPLIMLAVAGAQSPPQISVPLQPLPQLFQTDEQWSHSAPCLCLFAGDEKLVPYLEVLAQAKLSGSLVLSGRCTNNLSQLSRSSSSDPVEAVRELFSGIPQMRVAQGTNRLIRVTEPDVPTDILDVKIAHISFDVRWVSGQVGVYSAGAALDRILIAPEVVSFMREHGMEPLPFRGRAVSGSLFPNWPEGSPHLTGSLENVTLSEALDYVLKTFPGIWVYQNCPAQMEQKRDLDIVFYQLVRRGGDVIVTRG